jgi:hypothetical protein
MGWGPLRGEALCTRHAHRASQWLGAVADETQREAVLRVLTDRPRTATAVEDVLWREGRRPRPGAVSATLQTLWVAERVDRDGRPYCYRPRTG